jgi:ZIP family zinc transporter
MTALAPTYEEKRFALMVTLLSSLSTGLGGLIVYFFGEPTKRKVSLAMAFSAGVMLYISFVDMLPECEAVLGRTAADLAFFAGFVVFGLIHTLIPEPDVVNRFIAGGKGYGFFFFFFF